jgi:hypothetical protein
VGCEDQASKSERGKALSNAASFSRSCAGLKVSTGSFPPCARSYRTRATSAFRNSEAIKLPTQPSKTLRIDLKHSFTIECLGQGERSSLSIVWKSLINCCLAANASSSSSIRSWSLFQHSRLVRGRTFAEAPSGGPLVRSSTRDIVIGPWMLITMAGFGLPLSKCVPLCRTVTGA